MNIKISVMTVECGVQKIKNRTFRIKLVNYNNNNLYYIIINYYKVE